MKMKKLFLMLLFAVICGSVSASNFDQNEPVSLKGETKIRLVIDYSEIKIDGKSEEDWLSYWQAEHPEYNAKDELENELKPTVQKNLVSNINDKIKKKGAYIVIDQETNFTITVVVAEVEKKGSNKCRVTITDKSGNEIKTLNVKGSGGIFGSMSNLWGDGFEETGEAIGKEIAKLFK